MNPIIIITADKFIQIGFTFTRFFIILTVIQLIIIQEIFYSCNDIDKDNKPWANYDI